MTNSLPLTSESSRFAFDMDRAYVSISQFLANEARLLDEDRLREWFELLDDGFIYEIPLRVDRERKKGGNEYLENAYRIRDNKGAMRFRIERLYTGHARAEELASRTCRVVGSIGVESTTTPDVICVYSAVLIYRQRGNSLESEIIPARHRDLMRIAKGEQIQWLSRTVFLTEKSLATTNLAIIL
jgi:3-phenylpropionate/cinnamic acid dioxygenase small subunit